MTSRTFHHRSLAQMVLIAMVLFCCTVDAGRRISIAGISGMGALTLAFCGATWAVWFIKPVLPRRTLTVLFPLILFQVDCLGTLFWYHPAMEGVQLLTVGLAFLGTVLVTTRETRRDPQLASLLHRLLIYSSALPVIAWFLIIKSHQIDANLNITRPFALYSLTIVAVCLAAWLKENRPAIKRRRSGYTPVFNDHTVYVTAESPPRPSPSQPLKKGKRWVSLWPAAWAIFTAYVVLLGLSRTAFVAILIMFPLAVAIRGSKKSVITAALILALGAGSFFAILQSNKALYDRFFKEDAHLKVGGISINGTGRTQIWNLLLTTVGNDWLCGKGISASEDIVTKYFPNVGHPHNDYLRFYYDEGIVGLAIWLIFVAGLYYRMAQNLWRSVRDQSDDYPFHLSAILAMTAVLFSMLTDNSVCYAPVMMPLGIVVGSSIGTGNRPRRVVASSETAMAHPVMELPPRLAMPGRSPAFYSVEGGHG